MKKIAIAGKSAIWLDHGELVSESFQAVASTWYELKRDLFLFHAKRKDAENTSDSRRRKTRKRQTGVQADTSCSTSEHDDVAELRARVSQLLDRIKMTVKFNDIPCTREETSTKTIRRHWDEPNVFPNFKGSNSTNEFHRCPVGPRTYIVPPQSTFYNYNIMNAVAFLDELATYDLIIMDPPWRNKYIRRLKRVKPELAYAMVDHTKLEQLPIQVLTAPRALVAIWCTNAEMHKSAIVERFLPHWRLRHVHTFMWLKVNTSGELIGDINPGDKKQPYELLYLACNADDQRSFAELKEIEFIVSIPSIIHSHKPPLLKMLQDFLPATPRCLEIFARYLQPHFTSIGLETLKLMDERLYVEKN